jgi:hypothetical protein
MKARGQIVHGDPVGYFLTWVTYGTWLPGDARDWIQYRHGWRMPNPIREFEATARMSEDACILNEEQRRAVEQQISETCVHRGWTLLAVNCRSNHAHAVVAAEILNPKRIQVDLKAWTTRALKRIDSTREKWWAERGCIRYLNTDPEVESAIVYVRDGQECPRPRRPGA